MCIRCCGVRGAMRPQCRSRGCSNRCVLTAFHRRPAPWHSADSLGGPVVLSHPRIVGRAFALLVGTLAPVRPLTVRLVCRILLIYVEFLQDAGGKSV